MVKFKFDLNIYIYLVIYFIMFGNPDFSFVSMTEKEVFERSEKINVFFKIGGFLKNEIGWFPSVQSSFISDFHFFKCDVIKREKKNWHIFLMGQIFLFEGSNCKFIKVHVWQIWCKKTKLDFVDAFKKNVIFLSQVHWLLWITTMGQFDSEKWLFSQENNF